MHKPFIPNRDAEFDTWLANFAGLIAADPAAYGLSAGDAAELSAVQGAWHAAFALAQAPETRTRITIADKDAKRADAVVVVRRLAGLIRADDSVSDDLKRGLGVTVRSGSLTRARPPALPPTLAVTGFSLASHELLAQSPDHGPSLAKPRGAATLLVVRAVADGPAASPHDAAFLALSTRARLTSRFDAKDSGRVATYFARWANSRGELGPWSAPVSARIAA